MSPVVVRVLRPPLALAGGPAGFAALIFPAVVLVIGVTGVWQEPFVAVTAFTTVESHLGVLRVNCDTEDTLQDTGEYGTAKRWRKMPPEIDGWHSIPTNCHNTNGHDVVYWFNSSMSITPCTMGMNLGPILWALGRPCQRQIPVAQSAKWTMRSRACSNPLISSCGVGSSA